MPLSTNLDINPYWDDFEPNNEYYSVLFKPGVSVQTRELNNLQSILRHQIEKFGDQIFQTGTIIDGCNFTFYPAYPYVKIKDLTVDGLNVTLSNYVGLFTTNPANLQAIIVNTAVGFESTPPDLNTLYLSYRNSGNNNNTFAYSPGDVLTIFDSNSGIWAITVNNAGVAFSNSDSIVITPTLAVNVTSGSFSNGDYVTQPTTGANLQIVGIDTASLANIGQVILSLMPRSTDLANSTANGSQWQVANNDSIRNSGNTAVGSVLAIRGAGANASVVTDGSGRIVSVPISARGYGYLSLPTVAVRSVSNATGIATVSLVPRNYVTQVTVSNTTSAVGNGYAFGVTDGTIFQKGLFIKVDAQTIVIDKYDQTPNAVSVGFLTQEQIIDANIDTNLVDNAAGFKNYQAPGADRLKLIPTLSVQASNVSSPDYLPIVSWSEGNPYRQNQATAYSAIGDKMAQELYETEGDFVISRFEVTSRSPYTSANEGSKVSLVINPGSAYISGQRVFNSTNYSVDILKTTDTAITNGCSITLNYGNYLQVKELGGVFQFSTGDTVTFYDTAKTFISGGAIETGGITPAGNALGAARIRSLVRDASIPGIPGDPNCVYRLYLFDINLNQGVNFRDIRSVYYNNTYQGIADVLLTPNATLNANVAQLANSTDDDLLFSTGVNSLKNATNVYYTYRTIDQTAAFANSGLLTKSIAANPGEVFPYAAGALTAGEMLDLYVVPVGGALIAAANSAGTANILNSSNTITGSSGTWLSDYAAGDYVYLFQNSTVTSTRRVTSIANNTQMQLDSAPSFTANSIATYRIFPNNAPIPFGTRSGLSANLSANLQVLTLNLGMTVQGSVSVNTAIAVNITRSNVTPITKSAGRDQFIKIQLSNNAGGTAGPWCVGVSDIFRLKHVFMDTANTVSNTSTEVTSYFYIDHKQNEDYLDLGYLYIKPNSGLTLTASNFLLVQFDAFQTSGSGFADTVSYVGANSSTIATTDSTPLANLGSSISSWEIPEVFGSRGQYWDLTNQFDFRPIAANSATPTTNSATAPINPAYSLSFGNTANPANDKKFPLPDSIMTYNLEQYMGRIDSVFCDKNGNITVARGIPSTSSPKIPHGMKNSLRLSDVYIPPYPCLPAHTGPLQTQVLVLNIANINYTSRRQATKTIVVPSAPGTPYDSQPRRYTMSDVGTLDRRIQALEYYTSLSALQTDMVNRVVPSTVTPDTNRFKFGIFADAFDSTISQDVTNPSYAAAISQSNMTPPVVDWVTSYGDAPAIQLSYTDFKIISQPDATVPVPAANTPNTTPPILLPNNVTTSANVWLLRTDHLAPSQTGAIVLTDYAYAQMSANGGPATLYFYVNPTVSVVFGTDSTVDPDNFKIYQGSTLIADAYNNGQSLTSTDIAYLQSSAVPAGWFNSVPLSTPLSRPAAGWVNGAGKITFTGSASATYTIVSTRQSAYDHWLYGLQYPSSFGSNIVVSPSSTTSVYTGNMDVEPPTLLLAMTMPTGTLPTITNVGTVTHTVNVANDPNYTALGNDISALYGADRLHDAYSWGGSTPITAVASTTEIPQSFGLTVYGLKPLTLHNFTVNGVNKNSRCAPPGQALGAALVSDQYGILRFNWYFNGLGADQDVQNIVIAPNQGQRLWSAEVAASMAQPLSAGQLTLAVSAPGSSASFQLQVVADADMVLSTITNNETNTLTDYTQQVRATMPGTSGLVYLRRILFA